MNDLLKEEQTNPLFDVASETFDRDAYRAFLISKHQEIMQQMQERTWKVKPSEIDICSDQFDADAYIDAKICYSQNSQKLYEIIEQIGLMILPQEKKKEANDNQPTQRTFDVAVQQGALTTLDNRIALPSLKAYQDTLNNVMLLPQDNDVEKLDNGEIRLLNDAEVKSAEAVNLGKLGALFQIARKGLEHDQQHIQVFLPNFQREIGLDPRKFSTLRKRDETSVRQQRFQAFTKWFQPIERYMLPLNGKYYRACVLEGYDPLSETVTLYPSFFIHLSEELRNQDARRSVLNSHFSASVANEKDELAIEVAAHLTSKLLQRGLQPDNENTTKITYRVLFSTVVQECPQLFKALTDILTKARTGASKSSNLTDEYNKLVKRTFETAFKLIFEKSDFPKIYKNFQINGASEWEDPKSKEKRKADPKSGNRRIANKRFCIPTKSRMNTLLKITHEGKTTEAGTHP